MYLWYKKGEDAPVVDLQVLYDDDATPVGYVKVAKDLSKGTDSHVYLAFRRKTETETTLPIVHVRILSSDATGAGAVCGGARVSSMLVL